MPVATPAASTPNSVFGGQATAISQTAIALRASTELVHVRRVHLRDSAQLLPFISLRGVERYSELAVNDDDLYVINGAPTQSASA